MRRTPVVGTKAWFGPKGFLGWGWGPATWEGWASAAVIAAVCLTVREPWAVAIAVGASFVLVLLKGTSPGGPAEYNQLTLAARRIVEVATTLHPSAGSCATSTNATRVRWLQWSHLPRLRV